MKTISCLCLAFFAAPLSSLAEARPEPDKQADAALAKLAAEKRAAMIKFTRKAGEGDTMNSLGVFVSKDGFALVALDAVTTGQVPTVVTPEGKSLRFGTILKLFPEQGAALMKFDHKPDVIVPVGKEEPAIGDTIALIPWNWEDPQFGKIPPVVGDIMVKRSDISSILKEPKFVKVLSLGTGLSSEQGKGLAGSFAVDRNGNLVARFIGVKPYPAQTLITLYPVADIADEIGPLADGEKALKHPLPADVNPVDPATLDRDYTRMAMAMMQRDLVTGRRLLKDLMKRYPNSLGTKMLAVSMMIIDQEGGNPLLQLEDVSSVEPNDSKARQFFLHGMRSVLLANQGKDPIPEMIKAVECSPQDTIEARCNLAGFYLQSSPPRLGKAAELYQQIYPLVSDTIHLVEEYERLLDELGRQKEAAVVNERYYDLLSIYRQQRGEGR